MSLEKDCAHFTQAQKFYRPEYIFQLSTAEAALRQVLSNTEFSSNPGKIVYHYFTDKGTKAPRHFYDFFKVIHKSQKNFIAPSGSQDTHNLILIYFVRPCFPLIFLRPSKANIIVR